MSFLVKLRRVPPAGWAAIFAGLLILPGLGSFGFWDPWELGVADQARAVMRSSSLFDPTVGGKFSPQPPLNLFLDALGMKVFGVRELGARFFDALAGVGAILAVYWAGAGLFRRRAGLLAALALGSMPIFILQARQLLSDMPLVCGLALALGGFGRFAWPATGQRRMRDLAVAVAGMVIGLLSGGALIGVALPCLALTATIVAGWGLQPHAAETEGAAVLTTAVTGRDVPEGTSFGRGLLTKGVHGRGLLLAVALLGVGVLIVTLLRANVAGRYSILLGGVPRAGTPAQMFEYLIKQIGFGIFPWSALVVFALGRPLIRLGNAEERDGGRLAFGQLYLLIFAAFAFALATIYMLMTGDARFPALAALALAIGIFLDEALEGERSEPVLGLLIATGTMIVARDFFLTPEELVSVHLFQNAKVKWPPTITVGYVFLAVGLVVSLGLYTGLATRGRAIGKVAPRDLGTGARRWQRRLETLVVEVGRWGLQAAVIAAVLFGAFISHALLPMLSRHLSFKPVLESYARYAKGDEEIGKYRVEGHGTGFYSERELVDIPSQEQVVEFLRRPKRTFCLTASDELAALDASFKLAKLDYYVLDASSSRFLLLSNQLKSGEQDQNPLKKDVWMASTPPEVSTQPGSNETKVDWHGQAPPWTWRVSTSTTFENAVELVGADFPAELRRPGKILLTLYFRVFRRPPGGFKIFAHFDIPGEPRVIGDHTPIFPTNYWLPGEYIRDTYEVDVPLMTTPAGTYTALIGFWPGGEGKRWRITAGRNDGDDRVRLGTVEIR